MTAKPNVAPASMEWAWSVLYGGGGAGCRRWMIWVLGALSQLQHLLSVAPSRDTLLL